MKKDITVTIGATILFLLLIQPMIMPGVIVNKVPLIYSHIVWKVWSTIGAYVILISSYCYIWNMVEKLYDWLMVEEEK